MQFCYMVKEKKVRWEEKLSMLLRSPEKCCVRLQNVCVHSQKFCVPPRKFVFAHKERKFVQGNAKFLQANAKSLKYSIIFPSPCPFRASVVTNCWDHFNTERNKFHSFFHFYKILLTKLIMCLFPNQLTTCRSFICCLFNHSRTTTDAHTIKFH